MDKVSIIIPSRNEEYLAPTIEDLFAHAEEEIEVLVVLDGKMDFPLAPERPGLIYINNPSPLGMRPAINQAGVQSTGKWLMKLDAHSRISQGYDAILKRDCDMDWVMVGSRNELNLATWEWAEPSSDYCYLSSPWTSSHGYMRDVRWTSRDQARKDIMVDETMTIAGCMWFMSKEHYTDRIRWMDADTFGHFGEPQELINKTWSGGGRVMVNKNVKFAHGRSRHMYSLSWNTCVRMYRIVTRYWADDVWPHRIRDFGWLVDHFWPLPLEHTRQRYEKYYWEEDWRQKYYHA